MPVTIDDKVDAAEVTTVYTEMITAVTASLDTVNEKNMLEPEMYAKILASMIQPTMQLAIQSVQQQRVLNAQTLKTIEDTLFVTKQTTELGNSVTYNNQIKALDSYAQTVGALGQGGLVPSSDMFATLFEMINDLNTAGSIPTDTTVTKA